MQRVYTEKGIPGMRKLQKPAAEAAPALKTLGGRQLTEHDLASLSHLARFNNCVLKFVDRQANLKGEGFQVRELSSPGGRSFTTIRVARDLTRREYKKLSKAINPKMAGKPIEEILAAKGLESLLQLDGGVQKPDLREERRKALRGGIAEARGKLEAAGKAGGKREKARLQDEALETLQKAMHENIPHTLSSRDGNFRGFQSPRRALRDLHGVCEEKTIAAYALLESMKPSRSGMKLYPADVTVNANGVGSGHACLLAQLADGSYFMFDATNPQASGRFGRRMLKRRKGMRESFDVVQETEDEGGFRVSRFHQQLRLLSPAKFMTSQQYMKLGVIHSDRGEDAEAIASYNEALKVDRNSEATHLNLGVQYAKAGYDEKALEEYDAALKLNPRSDTAHYNLAAYHQRRNEPRKALAELGETVKINPLHADARRIRGEILVSEMRVPEAIEEYRIAAVADPKDWRPSYFLGGLYKVMGDNESAFIYYANFLAKCPAEGHEIEQRRAAEFIKSNRDVALALKDKFDQKAA